VAEDLVDEAARFPVGRWRAAMASDDAIAAHDTRQGKKKVLFTEYRRKRQRREEACLGQPMAQAAAENKTHGRPMAHKDDLQMGCKGAITGRRVIRGRQNFGLMAVLCSW
jgi:hypothetical protein